MSERKINLEEIISKTYGCEDIYEFQRSFDISVSMIKEICINVCKQVLELAAENAKAEIHTEWECNTGSEYYTDYAVVNKQSIIDTINQVE